MVANVKIKMFWAVAMALVAWITFFQVYPARNMIRNNEPGDLSLRHNEVCCSHCRINPFRIWNHEFDHPVFRAHMRPGVRYHTDDDVHKRPVHAYTPWHTIVCWCFGWMSYSYVLVLIYTLNGACLVVWGWYLAKLCSWRTSAVAIPLLLMFMYDKVLACLLWGNYGIILAAVAIFFYWALERRMNVLAGLAWAILMVKPQIAALFIFPLLFQRRYLTILMALGSCVMCTLVLAMIYHESPLDLLLQIPQIGIPYNKGTFIGTYFSSSYSMMLTLGSMGFWAVVCGILCWRFRNADAWWKKCLPVALIFPLWSYGQLHDQLVAWNLYVFLALAVSSTLSDKEDRVLVFVCVLFVGFVCASHGIDAARQSPRLCEIMGGWLRLMKWTLKALTYVLGIVFCLLLAKRNSESRAAFQLKGVELSKRL